MPERTDLAALPTSWALTIWDALPVYASVEGAVAVVLVTLLSGRVLAQGRRALRHHVPAAVAYLALFDPALAVVAGCLGLARALIGNHAAAGLRTAEVGLASLTSSAVAGRPAAAGGPPGSPFEALRVHVWDVLTTITAGAALAAIAKVLLRPALGDSTVAWLPIAVIGGMLAPLSFGGGALPALAVSNASGSLLAGSLWFAGAITRAVGSFVISALMARRKGTSGGTGVSRVEGS
jgi:hypothetical protein